MASSRQSFYVTQKIGPKQSMTPEGFLLCEEVPVARTGMMIYGPDETPIEAGPDGIVKIFREAVDVFSPKTIASALGKSVVDDHPEEDVSPANWKELSCGFMLNVRRGDAAMDDLLLADLMVTTPEGIEAVKSGKREVSLGYDADYDEVSPGVGKQSNIIINHVALVEQGRCGPRCAIGDKRPNLKKELTVAKKSNKFLDKMNAALHRAFKAKDAEELEAINKEVQDEMGNEALTTNDEETGGETHVHVHSGEQGGRTGFSDEDFQAHVDQNEREHQEMRDRIEALEQMIANGQGSAATTGDEDLTDEEKAAKAAKGETGDEEAEMAKAIGDEVPEELAEEAAKAKDSAYLADSFQDTVAMAEILVPGIRIPTYDRAAKPGQTFKKICGLRKQALDIAYVQPATRGVIEDMLGGKTLDTKNMTCDAARILFRSAAAAQRSANNSSKGKAADAVVAKGPMTIAQLNKLNRERFPV